MTTLRFAETSPGDLRASLSNQGYARIGRLLTNEQCKALRESYADPKLFRSRIEMSRFGFGRGEYKYFAKPLPDLVAELRKHLYLALREVANEWMVLLSKDFEFPAKLIDFLELCESQGQKRPTPLLLRYQAGDYNCLHQDLYGVIFFPFQVICNLSAAGQDFIGGELMLVEQRPRAQSVGRVINLSQGEGVVIATRYRPVKGARGHYRTVFRHGVSPVLSGERFTLGIIFHDAE
jgi:hypothetical protein